MSDTLEHKERTLQDIYDELSPSQKELTALILGAAVEDEDLSGNPDDVEEYDNLNNEQKDLIDFLVGHALAREKELEHSDLTEVDNFLAHFGVKGMKWGERKARPAAAPRLSKTTANSAAARRQSREKVRVGTASLKEAHIAGLKSTGHRVFNGLTGDKTFWKRQAQIAGVAAVVVGAAVAAPLVMPTSALAAVGVWAGANAISGTGAAVALSTAGYAAAGQATIMSAGLGIASVAGGTAAATSAVTNLGRAVRGNARVNKSYATLGSNIYKRQQEGNTKVQGTLNRSGSINKSKLKHDGILGDFLSHYGGTKLKQVV